MSQLRRFRIARTIPFLFMAMLLCAMAQGKVIYVDADATRANNGSSWANAYWCLQDALADARSGDEVRVAQGIHKPDQHVARAGRFGPQIVASGDRTASFELRGGVAIRGGYAGFGEPDPNARDIRLYETILSGDLKSDDGPGFANNAENSYHVVTASGTDAAAVLDAFTVTGGNANDTYGYGGGMDNRLGTPTVTNCTFSGNCGTRGGGMANRGDVPHMLSGPTLTNCVFSGNWARSGGGMCNWAYCGGTLTKCTFSGNTAENGGAMVITKSSEATLRNCTLTANWASAGAAGAIHCYGDCSATLVNTILWGNSPNEIDLEESSITVTYSDVQDGWPGIGNINTDPLFANPRGGDYHLKSQAGRWSPSRGGWVRDDVSSPCIDAGDPSTPVAFESSPNGGIINMGAHGGTAEASKSFKYSGGTGEPNHPYQIATAADLITLGDEPNDYGKHFIMSADIDLDPNLPGRKVFDKAVLAPDTNGLEDAFQGTPFTGVFDGKGHVISRLTVVGGGYLGLFGQLARSAEVKNLGVVDVNIGGSGSYVSGLVGDNSGLPGWHYGLVAQCYSTGAVSGKNYVGGLVGRNGVAPSRGGLGASSAGHVSGSYSTAGVSGETFVGGLVGCNYGDVTNCYSAGAVSGGFCVGGLVGESRRRPDGRSSVIHCYSTGAVAGEAPVGGLAGSGQPQDVTDCFWDTQTSGEATSAGGAGKTTPEMQIARTFLDAGWDFVDETANGAEDIWWILEGKDYPHLWWEAHD